MNGYDSIFHQCSKKRDVQAVFLTTSGKKMSNNYEPCFNRVNSVTIPSL